MLSKKSLFKTGTPVMNFFRTLKCEEVYLCDYQTFGDVPERIPCFVEEVYQWITT
jgi:hypothetical protein